MAVLTRGRRRWIVAAAVAASALFVRPDARAQTPETEVRAAFLYNFTKFVEWPAAPGRKPDEPFRICVVAEPAFVRQVESIVQGESSGGRPLVVATPDTPESAAGCQLLYLAQTERQRGARLLTAVRDLPVLTVGDWPEFLDKGGAVRFVLEDRRVRFDISLAAAERAHLRVSSNLLRVARSVRQNGARP